MDPDAEAVELAIRAMLGRGRTRCAPGAGTTSTGSTPAAAQNARGALPGEPVVHPRHPRGRITRGAFPTGAAQRLRGPVRPAPRLSTTHAPRALSREAHLFLSLDEMKAIRDEYRTAGARSARDRAGDARPDVVRALRPQDAQGDDPLPRTICPARRHAAPGIERDDDGSVTIHNLLKSTIAAATQRTHRTTASTGASRSSTTTRAIIAFDEDARRLLQGRDPQPPLGDRALRRRGDRHRRVHPRHPRHRPRGPSRSRPPTSSASAPTGATATNAELSRRLPAPAAHPAARSSPACATTATAWAFPRSTAPSGSTTATSATRWSTAAASA